MKQIFSTKVLAISFAIAVCYVVASIYVMNLPLLGEVIFGDYPLSSKGEILLGLLTGMTSIMSPLSLVLLFLVAILTGINIALLVKQILAIRASGIMGLTVSGSTIVGMAASGCASCGLPVLALLGIGGVFAHLPFQGLELSVLAIVLLLVSLRALVIQETKSAVCEITPRRKGRAD